MDKSSNNLISIPKTGKLLVPMTNDYLVKMLLQENNKVLKALVQDLLFLNDGDIVDIRITNPIRLGEHINDKTVILDIRAIMNNHSVVNLEVQVINEHNWRERSLYYLCKEYANLNKGDNYIKTKPVYHISILDFTLFPENPALYSVYQMTNVRNHHVYSRNLQLSMLDLTKIDMATEEDLKHHLDIWAKLFKSTKWEELHMLSQELPVINDVSETVYKVTAEACTRMELFAREDAIRRANTEKIYKQQLLKQIAEDEAKLSKLNKELADADAKLASADAKLASADAKLVDADAKIAEKDTEISSLKEQLAALQSQINTNN